MNKHLWLAVLLIGLLLGGGTVSTVVADSAEIENVVAPTSTARYRITFDATWSNDTHPDVNFPSSAHWSALVGATHNDSIHLWQVGELATSGIKDVAERGSNSALNNEVNAAIAADAADQWIQKGFSPFSGVSGATVEITATSDFPLLSLATMVAPSPDWFSGVDSLSLLDAGGNWKDTFTLEMFPYDAGTDSGAAYASGNQPTVPFEPIARYQGVAPFSAESLGTLTITLLTPPAELTEKIYLPVITR